MPISRYINRKDWRFGLLAAIATLSVFVLFEVMDDVFRFATVISSITLILVGIFSILILIGGYFAADAKKGNKRSADRMEDTVLFTFLVLIFIIVYALTLVTILVYFGLGT